MTDNRFGETPFSAGSLFGYRAFRASPEGYLVGPQYAQRFKSGENKAACIRLLGVSPSQAWLTSALLAFGTEMLDVMPGVAGDTENGFYATPDFAINQEHVGSLDCSCGFYAFFAGQDNVYGRGVDRVATIIEGYGKCTVGNQGFRAAKARLIALVRPQIPPLEEEYRIVSSSGEVVRIGTQSSGLPEDVWNKVVERYGVPIYESLEEATAIHVPNGQEQTDERARE